MADMDERDLRMALSTCYEPGDAQLVDLLQAQTPAELWADLRSGRRDTPWTRRARAYDPRPILAQARALKLRYLIPSDADWPAQLAVLDFCEKVQDARGMPLGLWVRGERSLAALASRSVSVVGSRTSTPYGDRVATEIGNGLVEAGVTVVSGGAYGIDAAAHRGALVEGGPTIAVVATGLDQAYPRAHESLHARIAEHGLVISELAPGQNPSRRRFITRNRIIAALSEGTVVVEAAVRSGARNTATWATACGRHVMAVPGPVSNATSFTPHWLIRNGEAELVTGVPDILEMTAPMGEEIVERPRQERLFDHLTREQQEVYEALPSRGARDAGDLALRSGLRVSVTLAALHELAELGMAELNDKGGWRLGKVENRPVAAVPG